MVFTVNLAHTQTAYGPNSRVRLLALDNLAFGADAYINWYTGTSIAITPYSVSGVGTFSNWVIALTGARGFTGLTGATGAIANPLTSIFTITNTTSATSTNSGALQVVGGAGIGGNLYIGGNVNITGNVVIPARPAFRVVGNGGAINATTTVTNAHWTMDYQQGTSLNTSTGIFTAPVAGLYSTHLVMRTNSNSSSTISQSIIYKNSSTALCMLEFGANTTMNHAGVSTIAKLEAGDTMKVVVSVGTLSFDGNNNWSVAYIG